MKKNLIALTLALLMALPVLGLAADVTAPVTPEVQAAQTAPLGGQYGRRWSQTAPETTAPQADASALLSPETGTDAQDQDENNIQAMRGRMQKMMGRMQEMQGHMQEMQGRMQNAQGRGQGRMGRNQQAQGRGAQGNAQGPNYADANNDGVCDNLGTDTQRNIGPGRNRR